jgi:parvulin-like peptidyl-prolyl isomerase
MRVSVILVKTEEEAKKILEKLDKGEDFAELAKKHSIGTGAEAGGDLGFMSANSMGKFSRIAAAMKIGEIKGPVKTDAGYHIIKVTDRKEGGILEFGDVLMKVKKEYQYKLLKDMIEELRKNAKIDINTKLLDSLKVN